MKKIRTSAFDRAKRIAQMGLEIGGKAAGHLAQRVFANEDKRVELIQKFLMGQTESLVDALGELKGTFMKGGQMLTLLGEHVLPPEVLPLLRKLQSDAPPVDWEVMQGVIREALGAEKMAELEIRETPIASASIGQVYHVRERASGQEFALKVQVPGIAEAIENDLGLMGKIFAGMGFFSGGHSWSHVRTEIHEMMIQEIDYLQEMKWTEFYFKKLQGDTRFVVPEPIWKYASPKTVCTRFEPGIAVESDEVARLPLGTRNDLARNALSLFLREFFEWHTVQTDPHFGNYRVRLNESGAALILYDFGAVREFRPEFPENYKVMSRGALGGRPELVREGIRGNGFLDDSDSEAAWKLLTEIVFDFVEPYRNGVYDFGKSDLPKRVLGRKGEIIRVFKLRPPPREVIFLDRRLAGVYLMMAKLGACFDARDLLRPYLN